MTKQPDMFLKETLKVLSHEKLPSAFEPISRLKEKIQDGDRVLAITLVPSNPKILISVLIASISPKDDSITWYDDQEETDVMEPLAGAIIFTHKQYQNYRDLIEGKPL